MYEIRNRVSFLVGLDSAHSAYAYIICLPGTIVTDSEYFKDSHHTWPEGYTAMRKFISLKGESFAIFRAFLY